MARHDTLCWSVLNLLLWKNSSSSKCSLLRSTLVQLLKVSWALAGAFFGQLDYWHWHSLQFYLKLRDSRSLGGIHTRLWHCKTLDILKEKDEVLHSAKMELRNRSLYLFGQTDRERMSGKERERQTISPLCTISPNALTATKSEEMCVRWWEEGKIISPTLQWTRKCTTTHKNNYDGELVM